MHLLGRMKGQVFTSQYRLLRNLCPSIYLYICNNKRVLKQKQMEEFCLTLRSKKHFLRYQEEKKNQNKTTYTRLQPCTLPYLCVILYKCVGGVEAVAHQLEYRKLLVVQQNRAQTASLCYSVPACLHLVFPSVRCFSRVNQTPSSIQPMNLPQDHR